MERLRAVGGLGKERVQAVPLRGSIIFITTAGIPLIKPENLFKQTKPPLFTVLSIEDEAIIVAFRRHTLLPLDDCLYALQATIPHLTRSSLHRCLQRHGINQLPDVEEDKPAKKKFKTYPIGFFHIDCQWRTEFPQLWRSKIPQFGGWGDQPSC